MKVFILICTVSICLSCKTTKNTTDLTYDYNYVQNLLDIGGIVTLPTGIFKIDQTLKITKERTQLSGVNMEDTTLDFKPGHGIEILASYVKVSDIHITNTYLNDGAEQHSINVKGPYTKVHIDHVKVTNGDDTGVRIGYALRRGKKAVAYDCEVTNCLIEDINEGSGIEVIAAEGVLIKGNTVRRTSQNGIRIASGRDCLIENNIIEDYNQKRIRYSSGVYVRAGKRKEFWSFCRNIEILNNKFKGQNKAIGAGTQTENVKIHDNIFFIDDVENGVGVSLENNQNGAQFGYRNIEIYNNSITGNFKSGIELHTRDNDPAISGQFVTIRDNYINGFNLSGISMRANNIGEVKDIEVYKNELIGKNSFNIFGIRISRCKNILVDENIISLPENKKIQLINHSTVRTK